MHPFSLLPGIWSPFTATVTSMVAALVFLPRNIYGRGEVATLRRVLPKKAITSEVNINLFVVSIVIRNALSTTAVTPVNNFSCFSPKSHYLQNQK